jgi:HK97 family phage prohead protease
MKFLSRNNTAEQIHIREDMTGQQYIEGYAIIFNQKSKLIREWGETFFEVIEPSAPDNVLSDPGLNVIATVDHDRSKMLGRNKSGTLELIKDSKGLKYRIKLPDTTLGKDMAEMIKRGDYFESSFIFGIAEKGMRYDNSEEIPTRYISDFSTLRDIAIVIDGAYANTAVKLRSQEYQENKPPKQTQFNISDILQKEIEILTFKI